MENISNWAKEIILLDQGRLREGRWLLDFQQVGMWQSFAQGCLTRWHCVPVIAALQQQMKLSAGRWLYSDSCSTLSLQSIANKYVGFQSCQGRRWTVGQGAKRGAKAFPSPRNLFSMSLVTSPGHPFSLSHPKGPRAPDLTHCPQGGILWDPLFLSFPVTAITLSPLSFSLSFSEHLSAPPHHTAKNILWTKQFKPFVTESDSIWWRWNDCSALTHSDKKYLFIKFPLMVKSGHMRQVTEGLCVYLAAWLEPTDCLQCEIFATVWWAQSGFSSQKLICSVV